MNHRWKWSDYLALVILILAFAAVLVLKGIVTLGMIAAISVITWLMGYFIMRY